MKTITQIKNEIAAIKAMVEKPGRPTKKEIKAINSKVRPLQHGIAYLETNPSEKLLESELCKVERRLEILDSRYESWAKNVLKSEINNEDPRKYYEKVNDYTHIKSQIKTLKYLLER